MILTYYYCSFLSWLVGISMAFISGLTPCLDFIPLILVVSCSFSCYNLLSYFFRSPGFFIIVYVPVRIIRFLHILNGRFEIQPEVLSSVRLVFLVRGLLRIIMGYPKEKLGQICSFLEHVQILEQEVVNGIDDFAIPVEKTILPLLGKLTFIWEYPQKLCNLKNDFVGLCLPCVDVNIRVEVLENLEDKISEFECTQLVQADKGNILFEGRLVQQKHNLFYIFRLNIFFLDEG